jgi:hypothetical protein
MATMNKPRSFVVSALVFLALGACTNVPTGADSASVRRPAAPSFDGGHVFGSGAATDTSNTTTATSAGEATVGDSTAVGRGGHVFGSGA